MSPDYPFVDLSNDWGERAEEQYEADIVGRLLTFYNASHLKRELMEEHRVKTGKRLLTLHQFHVRFPSFPVYLLSAKVSHLRKECSLDRLLKNPAHTKLYREFLKHRDWIPEEWQRQPCGLIHKWPYLKKPVILHNAGHTGGAGCEVRFTVGKEQFTIEPLSRMLKALTWRPEDE